MKMFFPKLQIQRFRKFEPSTINQIIQKKIAPNISKAFWYLISKAVATEALIPLSETLAVNSYDASRNQWNKTGISPYLDLDDGDINKIDNSTGLINLDGDYGFPNPLGIGTLTQVLIYFKGKVVGGDPGGSIGLTIQIFDGSVWTPIDNAVTFYVNTDTSYVLKSYDLTSILNTWAKVNSALLAVAQGNYVGTLPIMHLTYVYLYVTRTIP